MIPNNTFRRITVIKLDINDEVGEFCVFPWVNVIVRLIVANIRYMSLTSSQMNKSLMALRVNVESP
jgi:hypothetical protein